MAELDIVSIHQENIDWLIRYMDEKQLYSQKLHVINTLKKSGLYTEHTRQKMDEEVKALNTYMNTMDVAGTYNYYIVEVEPIMAAYKALTEKPIKMSFLSKKDDTQIGDHVKEKHNLAVQFIKVCRKYSPYLNPVTMKQLDNIENVELIDDVQLKTTDIDLPSTLNMFLTEDTVSDVDILEKVMQQPCMCPNCNVECAEIDSKVYACVVCGYETIKISTFGHCFKDCDRVNMTQKYLYDRRNHFKDCLVQYQSKQIQNVPDSVVQELVDQFRIHKLLVGDETTPNDTRFSNITREHVQIFLKELKYNKYYDDVSYIYHKLTGNEPENIEHLEEKLMSDFDSLIRVYDQKYRSNAKQRKNFINMQCVLYQLLRRHKHPCRAEDFNVLKTHDRKTYHDEILSDLFMALGWTYDTLM